MRCSILNMNKNFKDEGDNNEKTLSVYLDGSLVIWYCRAIFGVENL